MLKIIDKRWRLVEVIVIDTLVQGDKSAPQIAEALAFADTIGVDAIIVGRGGGSREDLWAFNEEIVADAIFNLKTFVVSAILIGFACLLLRNTDCGLDEGAWFTSSSVQPSSGSGS